MRAITRSEPISIGEPDKVTAWPFKEPEKTTSWVEKNEASQPFIPKDAPINLRDSELDKAKKRTALIKTRMSPPGALGLPPKLEAARLKWGIPDGAFQARAIFDRIHVFPLDLFAESETYGGTSIIRPEVTKKRDEQNGHRGVLISMGLKAADNCVSNGTELGHVVRTIRNAPHAQECERLEDFSIWYLVMRDGDLTGDETLEEEIRAGTKRIVDEGGEHNISYQIEGKRKRSPLHTDW